MTMSGRSVSSPRWLAVPLAAALITACASCATAASGGAAARTIADGQAFAMQPGDVVTLPDASRLRYIEVVADSRCPADVQCVWAGDAEVAFTRSAAEQAAEQFTLHSGHGARSHDFEGRRLTLVSLARDAKPQAQLQLERAADTTP